MYTHGVADVHRALEQHIIEDRFGMDGTVVCGAAFCADRTHWRLKAQGHPEKCCLSMGPCGPKAVAVFTRGALPLRISAEGSAGTRYPSVLMCAHRYS